MKHIIKLAPGSGTGAGSIPAGGDSTDVTDDSTRTPQVGYSTTTTKVPYPGYGDLLLGGGRFLLPGILLLHSRDNC